MRDGGHDDVGQVLAVEQCAVLLVVPQHLQLVRLLDGPHLALDGVGIADEVVGNAQLALAVVAQRKADLARRVLDGLNERTECVSALPEATVGRFCAEHDEERKRASADEMRRGRDRRKGDEAVDSCNDARKGRPAGAATMASGRARRSVATVCERQRTRARLV